MTALLYHRVSTTDQNPELAREELRQAARQRGADEVVLVEETGSGAANDRPGLQRVLEDARRGRTNMVLVWKLDRFGRSALDLLANIRALEDAGVRFVCVTQGIDVKPDGDAMSRLILTVLAGVAEFERELIRERTRLGLADRKRKIREKGGFVSSKSGKWRTALGGQRVDVDAGQVQALRAAGRSWAEVAGELSCTVATARRRGVVASDGRLAVTRRSGILG